MSRASNDSFSPVRIGKKQQVPKEKKKKRKDKKQDKKDKESVKLTPVQEARNYLNDHRGVWEKLANTIGSRCHIYQWKCYFRYT